MNMSGFIMTFPNIPFKGCHNSELALLKWNYFVSWLTQKMGLCVLSCFQQFTLPSWCVAVAGLTHTYFHLPLSRVKVAIFSGHRVKLRNYCSFNCGNAYLQDYNKIVERNVVFWSLQKCLLELNELRFS